MTYLLGGIGGVVSMRSRKAVDRSGRNYDEDDDGDGVEAKSFDSHIAIAPLTKKSFVNELANQKRKNPSGR